MHTHGSQAATQRANDPRAANGREADNPPSSECDHHNAGGGYPAAERASEKT